MYYKCTCPQLEMNNLGYVLHAYMLLLARLSYGTVNKNHSTSFQQGYHSSVS